MLLPETLLQDRYQVVSLLGQGGMGAVYLAIDRRLGHQIALKRMFRAQNEIMAQAFEREARILARLNHRSLPKVSDHFSEGDSRYLVMQYIEGTDLGELLEKNGRPFAPAEVLRWADDLLDALEYLHRQDPPILHRDIKPQNIKLNPRGELYLLDFGLAKDTATSHSKPLSTPSVIGYSFNYAPLEQIDRQGTTPETDVYSVCATLYHLLTGELPADALARLCAKADSGADPLVPADRLNPQVPPALADVLRRGLILRREDRLNTTALRALLRNPPAAGIMPPTAPFITQQSPPARPLSGQSVTEAMPDASQLTTQADFPTPVSPPIVKRGRALSPLVLAAVGLPLLGAGLGGAVIGYNQFIAAPVASQSPVPTPTVQTVPAASPTVEISAPPAVLPVEQNGDQPSKPADQSSKPVDQPKTSKTVPGKTPPPASPAATRTPPPIKKQTPPQKKNDDPVIILQ